MNYKHFGGLLKNIRTSNNFTLQDLAEGICSIRQLSRIEKGENDPSLYLLHKLSKKLNLDLQEYYRIISTSQSFESDGIKHKLIRLIQDGDLQKLRDYIIKVESMVEFLKGKNLQHILVIKQITLF